MTQQRSTAAGSQPAVIQYRHLHSRPAAVHLDCRALPRGKVEPVKILLCTIAYCKNLIEQPLAVARELGFDGIEVWGREPHVPEKFDENRMRAIVRLIESSGVTPYVFGSYLRFGAVRNDTDVELSDVLHLARWLKTPLVRVWASDVSSAKASKAVWDKAVHEAREASLKADKLGMALVVEMHAGTLADTAPSSLRFVEEVDMPNLRLNFQIASHDDGQTPEERLEMVLPWVSHVHAQNMAYMPSAENEKVRRSPLSAGVASYPRLLSILKEAGYEGDISVEFAHDEGNGKAESLAGDLNFLRALL